MNTFYRSWLDAAQARARAAGLVWNPEFCLTTGKIEKSQRWPLRQLIGLPSPETWLARFHHSEEDMTALLSLPPLQGLAQDAPATMAQPWREFLQAAVINELLIKRNKVTHAVAISRVIRILSLSSGGNAPWQMTAANIRLAYNIALRSGGSGKLAMNVKMVVKELFDRQHLCDNSPLAKAAEPFLDECSRAAQLVVEDQRRREGSNYNVHTIRSNLNDRKAAERLPEQRALWELIRIIFSETPLTFTDRIRFNALKMHILTGFRVGETVLLPKDCLRWREYFDAQGRPAGEKGGFSRSLSLRYFALKQDVEESEKVQLVERWQEVPAHFEQMVADIVNETLRVTEAIRERLKRQTAEHRLFPEYGSGELVSAVEMYTRVAGSIRTTSEPISNTALAAYRAEHSMHELEKIRAEQTRVAACGPVAPVSTYWQTSKKRLPVRDESGAIIMGRIDYRKAFFRVGDVENYIKQQLPTKLPDTEPFIGPLGTSVFPHELLFLHPSRSLIEGRDGGLIDVGLYFSIGRLSEQDLQRQLNNPKNGLFARYGETEEDRKLSLNLHSTRHLQNSELFRLGVADTVITKRFGRVTTAQSYVYDHRSLLEVISAIDLPSSAQALVPPRAHDTVKLILAGQVKGPLVDEFEQIQLAQGDDAAFEYIAAEADGLHSTPYGFCLNSFTVDPCPQHLQCFNGCRNLARTDAPTETDSLRKVRNRTRVALNIAESSPARTPGRKNQIAHAKTILENIELAIDAKPGSLIFPKGEDLSDPIGKPMTIMDAPPPEDRRN